MSKTKRCITHISMRVSIIRAYIVLCSVRLQSWTLASVVASVARLGAIVGLTCTLCWQKIQAWAQCFLAALASIKAWVQLRIDLDRLAPPRNQRSHAVATASFFQRAQRPAVNRSAHTLGTVEVSAMSRNQAGFTLLEILVVLVIVAIMIAIAVVRFSGYGSGRAMRQTIRRWSLLMPAVQMRAVLQPAVLGLKLQQKSFQIYHLDENLSTEKLQWVPLKGGRLSGVHHFARGITVMPASDQPAVKLAKFLLHPPAQGAATSGSASASDMPAAAGSTSTSGSGPSLDDGPSGGATDQNNTNTGEQVNGTATDAADTQNGEQDNRFDSDQSDGQNDGQSGNQDTDSNGDQAGNQNDADTTNEKSLQITGVKPDIIISPNGDVSATQLVVRGAHGMKPVRIYINAGGEVYTKDKQGRMVLPFKPKK